MGILKKIVLLVGLFFLPNYFYNYTNEYVDIIHFNDVYQMYPGDGLFGASKFTSFVKNLSNENSIIIFSGDALSPSKTSFMSKGSHMIDILNEINVDYCTVGNHEMDYGVGNMEEKLGHSNCTWILSNLHKNISAIKTTFKNVIDYQVVDTKIGPILFLGLAENWIGSTRLYEGDFFYENMIENAKKIISQMKKTISKSFKVIAITHAGVDLDKRLLLGVPEIDLVLGGHDHMFYLYKDENRYIVKSGSDFNGLSVIRMYKNKMDVKQYKPLNMSLDLKDDPWILGIYEKYNYNQTFNRVLGNVSFPIDLRKSVCRKKQCKFGKWFADISNDLFDIDDKVTLINAGTIRSHMFIETGELTFDNMLTIFPYQTYLVSMKVDGKIIIECMKISKSKIGKGSYLIYSSNLREVDGDYYIDGKIIEENKIYNLITTDFLSLGRDGYSLLRDYKDTIENRLKMHEFLDSYLSKE